MKNLKIGMKLIVGFAIVLLLMGALIISGISSLISTNQQVTNYAEKTVPNTNYVWQIRYDLVGIQRDMLTALVENDKAEMQVQMDEVAQLGDDLAATMVEFGKNARVDASEVEYMRERIVALSSVRAELTDYLLQGTPEGNEKAFQIFQDVYKPGVDEIIVKAEQIAEQQNGFADEQKTAAESAYRTALMLMIIFAVVAVVSTIIIVLYISKAISRPVKEIEQAMEHVAQGDYEHAVISYQSKDELGVLADNIRKTMDNISFIIRDLSRGLTEISQGNFDSKSENNNAYIGAYEALAVATYGINTEMSKTLGQINQASDQVSVGADQVASGAQALSQGATEQAAAVEQLSATITEISGQVRKNAENAVHAREEAQKAGTMVGYSNERMQEMIDAVNEINNKSAEIGKIIKTIEDIAFQTNILALNAAVEAARAGDAGKGFAVVADEVRNLAGKSAEAAKNTTSLIEETVQVVSKGTQIADEAAKAMMDVVEGANNVTTLIVQIAEASDSQSHAIEQVTTGLDQISAVVQTNSATAEESAAASEELAGQSTVLKQLVSSFTLAEVDHYTGKPSIVMNDWETDHKSLDHMDNFDKY